MGYRLDLSGCVAKHDRANKYIDDLRRRIAKKFPDGIRFPLRQKYKPKQHGIFISLYRLEEFPKNWGLIVGDAAHNLRSALDHLAWQLALRKFKGVVPTVDKIIKQIQFPVTVDKDKWIPGGWHRKHMSLRDAAKLKEFQPFNLSAIERSRGAWNVLEELAGFNGLDNIDKHRTVHLVYGFAVGATFPQDPVYSNCEPVLNAKGNPRIDFLGFPDSPKEGDEILYLPLTKAGSNPKVNFEGTLFGEVSIGKGRSVIQVLGRCTELVSRILAKF